MESVKKKIMSLNVADFIRLKKNKKFFLKSSKVSKIFWKKLAFLTLK